MQLETNLPPIPPTRNTQFKGRQGDDTNSFLKAVFNCNDDFTKGVIKSITPTIAAKLLERNTRNRTIRPRYVDWLAKQMELGYWMFAADVVRFGNDGTLLDKQHTLHAVLKSGTTQKFLVICGLDESVFNVLDTGVARTAGDVLKVNGLPNSNTVAGVCRQVLLFRANHTTPIGKGHSGSSKQVVSDDDLITNMRILEEVRNNPFYVEAASMGHKLYDSFRPVKPAQFGSWYFLFSEKSPDDASAFLGRLATGIGLEAESPVFHLRKRLEQEAMSNIQYNGRLKTYWFIACWNKFRKGESMKILQTPPSPFDIPEIL